MRAVTTPASAVPYDNTQSGLAADNAQDAIDELSTGNINTNTPYAYMQIPNRLVVKADSGFTTLMDAGVRVFKQELSNGFETIGSVVVYLGGNLAIESNSKGIIRGA
jgi:hypothetical protein